MKRLWIAAFALLVAACGKPTLDGVYSGALVSKVMHSTIKTEVSFTFKPNGKVSQMILGTEHEVDYVIEGDKIRIKTVGADTIFTLLEDGTIRGPMGVILKKE